MADKLLDKLLEYVKIDSQSDPSSESVPSTLKQKDMTTLLEKQLKALDIEVIKDKNDYLVGYLKSNIDQKIPAIGFLAHVDTSPDYSGKDVKPIIHENYDGKDIVLNNDKVISVEQFPEFKDFVGKTIVTSDGTTLLGGDDKAGVAIVMELLEYLQANKEVKHGDIYVAFTYDEEIGTGVDNFDTSIFKADYAFTLDGSIKGEFNYETFNAASFKLNVEGVSVHPGTAKNVMVNALEVINEFHDKLPVLDKPEYTEGYEGFYMLMGINGSSVEANSEYIIRDHNTDIFNYRKEYIERVAKGIQNKYATANITYEIKDQYYNMANKISPELVDMAKEAYKAAGVDVDVVAVRGGTDGSKLSYLDIPTPNIFTGGGNFHGPLEYVVVETMHESLEVLKNLVKLSVEKG